MKRGHPLLYEQRVLGSPQAQIAYHWASYGVCQQIPAPGRQVCHRGNNHIHGRIRNQFARAVFDVRRCHKVPRTQVCTLARSGVLNTQQCHGLAKGSCVKRILDNEIEKLLVIADPHTLGVMRGHYHRELEKRLVGELAKTLTNADTAQIEQAIGAA